MLLCKAALLKHFLVCSVLSKAHAYVCAIFEEVRMPARVRSAWLADVPAKAAVVPPSVFTKEQPASAAPRTQAPQQAEPKALPEEALPSTQDRASMLPSEHQVRSEGLTGRLKALLF